MKKIMGIYPAPDAHWVGDGFNVRTMLTYNNHGRYLSPFLLLDRAGPTQFSATERLRGVGGHPHKGFETVTIVYDGEVAHHDSTGEGGVIGPGDVQWMTAASGILHEEYHSRAFAEKGGMLDMVQLWVNLPAKDKLVDPCYQSITNEMIPVVELGEAVGILRLIAGKYADKRGPAKTFTDLDLWDLRLKKGAEFEIPVINGQRVGLVLLHGEVNINAESTLTADELAIFDKEGDKIFIKATKESVLLLLSGEEIEEPIAGHGPFVMNTRDELKQASLDFMAGKFGKLETNNQ